MKECNCAVISLGDNDFLDFCPLHSSAPYMLEALRAALSYCERRFQSEIIDLCMDRVLLNMPLVALFTIAGSL
jgi:hypothetical protein